MAADFGSLLKPEHSSCFIEVVDMTDVSLNSNGKWVSGKSLKFLEPKPFEVLVSWSAKYLTTTINEQWRTNAVPSLVITVSPRPPLRPLTIIAHEQWKDDKGNLHTLRKEDIAKLMIDIERRIKIKMNPRANQ